MLGLEHHEAVRVANRRRVRQHDGRRAPGVDDGLAASAQANVEVDVDAAELVENEETRGIDALDRLGIRVIVLEEPRELGGDQVAVHLVGPEHVLVAVLLHERRVRPRALHLLPRLGQLVRLVGLVDGRRHGPVAHQRVEELARMVGLQHQHEPRHEAARQHQQGQEAIAAPTHRAAPLGEVPLGSKKLHQELIEGGEDMMMNTTGTTATKQSLMI